jgi:hypothetical protein
MASCIGYGLTIGGNPRRPSSSRRPSEPLLDKLAAQYGLAQKRVRRLPEDWYDPSAGYPWDGWTHDRVG